MMDKKSVREEMKVFIKKLDAKPLIEDILQKPKSKKQKESVPDKKHAEYFEGQLQLRKVSQEVLDYVHKRFVETHAQIPTQKIHSQGNIDYWVSSKKLLHKLAKELKTKFGGFTKESEQLFSQDHLTSKGIYRLNVFYEMHEEQIGDLLICEGILEPCIVTGFKGDRLVLKEILSQKKKLIKTTSIEKKVKSIKTKVVSVSPHISILDSVFQQAELLVPKGVQLQIDENVVAAEHDGKWYFVKS